MYKMSITEGKIAKIYRKLTKKRELKAFKAEKRKKIIQIRMGKMRIRNNLNN